MKNICTLRMRKCIELDSTNRTLKPQRRFGCGVHHAPRGAELAIMEALLDPSTLGLERTEKKNLQSGHRTCVFLQSMSWKRQVLSRHLILALPRWNNHRRAAPGCGVLVCFPRYLQDRKFVTMHRKISSVCPLAGGKIVFKRACQPY